MNKRIETGELILRSFVDEDIEPLFKIQSDPQAMRYTFCAQTSAESAHRLRAYAALEKSLGFAPWTIVHKAENRVIGWGGLNIDPFDPGWGVEVAYFFHPAYWGKGYGTELVRLSIEQGFYTHGLDEICAFVRRDNQPSIHVLEKNRFVYLCFEPRINRLHYVIHKT